MPPQPHFETYLKSKGLTLQQPYSSALRTKEEKIIGGGEFEKKRATTPTALAKKNSFANVDTAGYSTASTSPYESKMKDNINMLRMSQNILKNQIKESNQSGYENKENKDLGNNDIKLLNKDQELNFGDKDDEEEEEDGSENGNDNQEDTTGDDEQHTDVGIVTKINFSKKTDTKSPRATTPSNKGVHTVKTNTRNIKAEADVNVLLYISK